MGCVRLVMALAVGLAVSAAGLATARTVLATARASGPVEASRDGGAWEAFAGGQVADGVALRSGAGGTVSVELPNGDLLGVGSGTELRFVAARPPAVHLVEGRVVLHLVPGSPLVAETDALRIREPRTAGLDTPPREATVIVADGETSIACTRGEIEVVPHDGTPRTLAAGETATFAADDPEPSIAHGTPAYDPWAAPHTVGNPASDPRIKASPLMAQLAVAAAVIVSGVAGCLGFF